jgi:tetratricopeptide (TPR) repeat protein
MAWFIAEHPVLLAAMEQAASSGFDRHICHLAGALFVFQHRRGHWHDRAATQQAALDAARRLGDRIEQARAHRNLGFAHGDLGRYEDAHLHLGRALELSGAGDPAGQAWTHHHRDLVYAMQGRDADALDAAQQALELFSTVGDRYGQASTLAHLGASHYAAGDSDAARQAWRRAWELLDGLDPSAADQIRTQLHQFDASAAAAFPAMLEAAGLG